MNPYTKMSYEDARAILNGGVYGILATAGEDGLPYGVPLTYAVQGNRLYFHGAGHGQKLKNIGHNPRVSFTVVEGALPDPEHYTLLYRSVIAFGEARLVTDPAEKQTALQAICAKYGADASAAPREALGRVAVIRMDVEYLSGKANG